MLPKGAGPKTVVKTLSRSRVTSISDSRISTTVAAKVVKMTALCHKRAQRSGDFSSHIVKCCEGPYTYNLLDADKAAQYARAMSELDGLTDADRKRAVAAFLNCC